MMMTTNKQGNEQPQGFGFKPDEFRYYKASLDCEKIKDLLLAEPCRNDLEKEELLAHLRSAQISICGFFSFQNPKADQIVFADVMRRHFPETKPPSEEQAKATFLRQVDAITGIILSSLGAFNDEDKVTAWKETAKVNFMVGVLCENKSSSDRMQLAKNILSERARKAVNARHDKPDGNREKQAKIREIWASGKYSTRDRCAEQECAGLSWSHRTTRNKLKGTPDPNPWPAKK